jgi:methionyl-tRNA formyltransferase
MAPHEGDRVSVGLYLMTEKGLAVLQAALDSGVEIAHVTTAPAKGMNDDAHLLIASGAKARGIPTFLRAHPPEFTGSYSIAAGWRWMLDVPNLVVLHDSLLPRYRGFSPLITALVNGEPQVGVTAFLAESEPDTGPIIAQHSLPVIYPARMRDVLDRLVPVYRDLAAGVCATLAADEPLRYTVQDHSKATYSLWRDEADYRIDWTQDDRRIVRLVDAASDPFPGAWTTVNGEIVRVMAAQIEPDIRIEDRVPGKVAFVRADKPVVVCGSGLVRITDPFGRLFFDGLKTRFV